MSITFRSNIEPYLRPGLYKIRDNWGNVEREYSKVYGAGKKSQRAMEYWTDAMPLTPASIIQEGQRLDPVSLTTDLTYRVTHLTVAKTVGFTKEAKDDNLYYVKEFNNTSKALFESIEKQKEILGFNILNTAFNDTQLPDGQPLASSLHPCINGTWSNRVGGAGIFVDLSEAGLEQAILLAKYMKDPAGNPMNMKLTKLVIPAALEFQMIRLLKSEFRPAVGNNDVNAIKFLFPNMPYITSVYLSSNSNWFGLTDKEDERIHFERQGIEYEKEMATLERKEYYTASARFSFSITPRGIIGAQGAPVA